MYDPPSDNTRQRLSELSAESPLLVIFLRHAGCPFCRETLRRLREARAEIESAGTGIALVHMLPDAEAASFFARYGVADLPRFSDPERKLYAAFELPRGKVSQVMGPAVWWSGFKTTILQGNLPGVPQGDVFQLPGTILLHRGTVLKAYRPENSALDVDLAEFACPIDG